MEEDVKDLNEFLISLNLENGFSFNMNPKLHKFVVKHKRHEKIMKYDLLHDGVHFCQQTDLSKKLTTTVMSSIEKAVQIMNSGTQSTSPVVDEDDVHDVRIVIFKKADEGEVDDSSEAAEVEADDEASSVHLSDGEEDEPPPKRFCRFTGERDFQIYHI